MKSSILLLPVYYSLVFSCIWPSVYTCISSKMEKVKEHDSLNGCVNGVCMPLNSCKLYLQKLSAGGPNDRKEVLENTCGEEKNRVKVCCPSQEPTVDFFPKKCGNSKKLVHRIIGGKEAQLGQFPWMASIGYEELYNGGLSFRCAGSLINTRYVLTAAHCLNEKNTISRKLSIIRLGEFNFSSTVDCANYTKNTYCAPPPIDAKAEKVILHPDYDVHSKHGADIALIRLDRTIDLEAANGYIAPVCLPPLGFYAEYEAQGRELIAVGWGITSIGGGDYDTPETPYFVHLPFAEQKNCEKYFRENLGKSQICVGGGEDKDTCNGDSGGPLMLLGQISEPYLQVGITSFGLLHCGNEDVPGIYTTVSHYIDWMAISMEPW